MQLVTIMLSELIGNDGSFQVVINAMTPITMLICLTYDNVSHMAMSGM